MIALIKLIIILVLSIFPGEPTEEKISVDSNHLEQFQYQKMDMLIRCKKSCVPS
ncbi:hypothetical protein JM83_2644 [Gillisia sp. Hel_I_86]|nr:hypothetical protein JM83_2644 [Gillisia sp. Hel_I_86]